MIMAKAIRVKVISEYAESYIDENYSEYDPHDSPMCEAINAFVDSLLDDESMSEDIAPEARWKVDSYGDSYCGRCNYKTVGGRTKYCPSCGSKMKIEEKGGD